MTVVFSCHKETTKLHVGQVLTAVVPVTQEELVGAKQSLNFLSFYKIKVIETNKFMT